MTCTDCGTSTTDTWFFPNGVGMPVGPVLCTECMSRRVKSKAKAYGTVLAKAKRDLMETFPFPEPKRD